MEPEIKKRRLAINVDEEFSKQKLEWFDLPYDVRIIVIKMMDNDTKLSYMFSSDDCAADLPKKLFKSLRCYNNALFISFRDDPNREFIMRVVVDRLVFYKEDIHQWPVWEVNKGEDSSTILAKYCQKIIRNSPNLEFFNFQSTNCDRSSFFNMISIKNLTSLKFVDIRNTSQVDLFECGFMSLEQLSNITDLIYVNCMSFDVFQLKQLKAGIINIRSKTMASKDINEYLSSFVNGEIHENVGKITLWNDSDQELESQKIIDGLQVFGTHTGYLDMTCYDGLLFALVCTVKNIRIALVEFSGNKVVIQFASKTEFENRHDYRLHYRREIEEYLRINS